MVVRNPKRTIERAVNNKKKILQFEQEYPEVSQKMLSSITRNIRILSDTDKNVFTSVLDGNSVDDIRTNMMLSEKSVKNSLKRVVSAVSHVYPHPDLLSKSVPVWEKVRSTLMQGDFIKRIKRSGCLKKGTNLHGNADGKTNIIVKLHKQGKSFEEISAIVGIPTERCKIRFNNHKYAKKK